MSIQAQSLAKSSAALQFQDAAGCMRWIAGLPVTNVQLAHQMLSEQVSALTAADVPALERLKILEALKETSHFAQAEVAKRYLGKPLPLDQVDAQAWKSVIGLWHELGANYQRCLSSYREGDLAISPFAALVTLRCLRAAGHALFEHYQVYREPDAAAWRAFHQLFAFAEEHGISRMRVQDVFARHDADSSCAEAYAHALLANLANPYSLSVRQMVFLQRWLDKWSSLVNLSAQPLPPGPIPPIAVDFSGDAPATLAERVTAGTSVRYLDLEQIAKTLRQTINLLKQGQTPGKLGLGDDARQPGCESLIMLFYVQWCRAGTLRTEERQDANDPAEVCLGIADSHKLLGGVEKPDVQATPAFSSRDKWEMDNLGYSMRLSTTAKQIAIKKSENWQILNQSNSGFMCMLRDPTGLLRMSHNQLLSLRRGAEATVRLSTIQWIKVNEKNECQCGIRTFPGAPKAISVRPSNFNLSGTQNFEQALLLPDVAMPVTPMSVILPAGWFQAGRMIEIQGEKKQVAQLLHLVERGADFDRAAFAIMDTP
jgi:cyclic-di-GMP-binding protein